MVSSNSAIGIALNPEDGDIFFQNAQLQTVQGYEFTAQNIDERINTRYGELYFLKDEGIDRESIIHSSKEYEIEAIIKSVISATHTVNKITSFDMKKDNKTRTLNIDFSVNSIFDDDVTSSISL